MRCLVATGAANLRHVALSATVLIALTGCATAASAGVQHTVTHPRTVAAATAIRCTTKVLRLAGGREGASETAIGFIEFTNTGQRRCTLRGYPHVTLIWHRRALPVRDIRPRDLVVRAVVLAPGKRDAGQLMLSWVNWCGHGVHKLSVRIAIPGTGTVTIPFNGPPESDAIPGCIQQGKPSQLRVESAYRVS